jgi:hypothetical protein
MLYSSARGANPRLIVVHTGEGILNRVDMARFLDNNSGASAHAASDAGGVEAPLVPYGRAAWTAGPTANSIGLHIELCAFAQMTREQWLSTGDVTFWVPWLNANRTVRSPLSMLRHSAAWVRSVADAYQIPLVKLSASEARGGAAGICGHADTSTAFGETDHTDPGPGFPWDTFIALVQGNAITEEDMPLTDADVNKIWMYKLRNATNVDGQEEFALAVEWITESADRLARTERRQILQDAKLDAIVAANNNGTKIDEDRLNATVAKSTAEATERAVNFSVLPALRAVLRDELGVDNEEQAKAIVAALGARLSGGN